MSIKSLESGDGSSKAAWNSNAIHSFCDICINEIEVGNRPNTYFSKEGWENISKKFFDATGAKYTKQQFCNKYDNLKDKWKHWRDLKKETGLGWDQIRCTFIASNDWWKQQKWSYESSENKRIWEGDQAFAFKVQQIQNTVVDIKVRDRAAVVPKDSLIGSLKFTYPTDAPRRVIPDTPFAPQWYSLENSKGVQFGPELMLSLWTGTQSDEVFSTAWHSDACAVDGSGIANTRGKVYLAPKLWYLRVNIIQAQELIPIKSETPQVFVKATVGDVTLRTKVSPNKNLNPKWGEDLMFVVAEPFNDFLYLSVERVKDDLRNSCRYQVKDDLRELQ